MPNRRKNMYFGSYEEEMDKTLSKEDQLGEMYREEDKFDQDQEFPSPPLLDDTDESSQDLSQSQEAKKKPRLPPFMMHRRKPDPTESPKITPPSSPGLPDLREPRAKVRERSRSPLPDRRERSGSPVPSFPRRSPRNHARLLDLLTPGQSAPAASKKQTKKQTKKQAEEAEDWVPILESMMSVMKETRQPSVGVQMKKMLDQMVEAGMIATREWKSTKDKAYRCKDKIKQMLRDWRTLGTVGPAFTTPETKADMERLVKEIYLLDTEYSDNKGKKLTQQSEAVQNVVGACFKGDVMAHKDRNKTGGAQARKMCTSKLAMEKKRLKAGGAGDFAELTPGTADHMDSQDNSHSTIDDDEGSPVRQKPPPPAKLGKNAEMIQLMKEKKASRESFNEKFLNTLNRMRPEEIVKSISVKHPKKAVGKVLQLKDTSQVMRDIAQYLGDIAQVDGTSVLGRCSIARQFSGCPFPSEVETVSQLMTEDPVTISVDLLGEQYYLVFRT